MEKRMENWNYIMKPHPFKRKSCLLFVQTTARLPDKHTWGSGHTNRRGRFISLSKQVGVRFAMMFGYIEWADLKRWLKLSKTVQTKVSWGNYRDIKNTGDMMTHSFFLSLKKTAGEVNILVRGCWVWNCQAGGPEEDETRLQRTGLDGCWFPVATPERNKNTVSSR